MKPRPVLTAETKMQTIADKYGIDFGSDNTMALSSWLKKKGYKSLALLLRTETKTI